MAMSEGSSMSRQFIDTLGAVPELREVAPRRPLFRNGLPVNARPEPAAPASATPKSYRDRLAGRIARSPFTPAALEVLLREFSWLRTATPVQRIARSGRSDEDIELFVRRLEDPFLYLPGDMYRRLVALGHIRPEVTHK